MPSKRRQLNVRLDEAREALLARLLPAMRTATGNAELSQSDVVMEGLAALARQYLPDGKGAAPSLADHAAQLRQLWDVVLACAATRAAADKLGIRPPTTP